MRRSILAVFLMSAVAGGAPEPLPCETGYAEVESEAIEVIRARPERALPTVPGVADLALLRELEDLARDAHTSLLPPEAGVDPAKGVTETTGFQKAMEAWIRREKEAGTLKDRFARVWLQYVNEPPEQAGGQRYLPGLLIGDTRPGPFRDVRDFFGGDAGKRESGLLKRTIRHQFEGWVQVLEAQTFKKPEKVGNVVYQARVNWLLYRMMEELEAE